MLVTRGLGRNGSAQGALLATFGLGRQLLEELSGKFLRRYTTSWRSRWRKRDLEQAPIRDQKEFARRVKAAIEALQGSGQPELAKRAKSLKEGLLKADSAKRRSLLQVDLTVLIARFEQVEWALDAYEALLERRRRDDEAVLALIFSSL